MSERHADGTFSHTVSDFSAVYAEIKRLDQLRGADQVALSAALLAAKTAVDAALAAAEKAVAAALIAAKEAVTKAETAQQRTNENQNEFRGQLRDQANTFLTRNEYDLAHQALLEKLEGVAGSVATVNSRLDRAPELRALQADANRDEGRAARSSEFWTRALAVLAVMVAAGTLIVLTIRG